MPLVPVVAVGVEVVAVAVIAPAVVEVVASSPSPGNRTNALKERTIGGTDKNVPSNLYWCFDGITG